MTFASRVVGLPGVAASRAWFSARSRREQALLTGLALVAVAAGLMLGVWRPLMSHRAAALAEIARYDGLLASANVTDKATLNLNANTVAGTESSVAGSAASHGLSIRRIEPEGENTRLTFEEVDFAGIVDWIADMDNANLARVVAIQLERRPEPGTVNAQVTLEE